MNKKLIWMPLVSLLFLGCTKTMKIDNRSQVQYEEPVRVSYQEAPVRYQEEIPPYEPRNVRESRVVVSREIPYTEEVSYIEEIPTLEKVPYTEEVPYIVETPTVKKVPHIVKIPPVKKVPHRVETPIVKKVPHIVETAAPLPVRSIKPFNIEPLDVFDKILENPNVLVLDVRSADEIPKDGKIANSVMIPLQVLGQNLNRLDKSKEIIVYCHTGNRSVRATKLLRKNGFDAVNMVGGIERWKRDHLSVKWK